MKKLVDLLILLGALGIVSIVVMKVVGIGLISGFGPLVVWRFSMGCLVLAIALLLRQK